MKYYHVLEANSTSRLSEVVFSYLSDGWNIAGGIAVAKADDGNLYFWQAMTKDEK